jgi:hypothetical protein
MPRIKPQDFYTFKIPEAGYPAGSQTIRDALALFPDLIDFIGRYQKNPDKKSIDPREVKLAMASKIIKQYLTNYEKTI